MNESNVAIFWFKDKDGSRSIDGNKLCYIVEEFIWGCYKVKGCDTGRDDSGKSFSPGIVKAIPSWGLTV